MNRFVWTVACLLCLTVGLLAPAHAQRGLDTELGRDWEFRLGFFYPERDTSRQVGGDIWLAAGVERAFLTKERYRVTLSLDYYGARDIYNFPILMNLRGETGGLRYGVGAGFSMGKDGQRGINNFAYSFLLGYTLVKGSNPIVFDIRYMAAGRSGGMLNGWSGQLGIRF